MTSEMSRNTLLDAWTEATTQWVESVIAANRTTMAAFSAAPPGEASGSTGRDDIDGANTGEESTGVGPGGDAPDWETDVTAEQRSELEEGDRFSFTKTLTDEDVRAFAGASGDTNPLHLDEEYAEATRFGGRIAHGTLVGGLISAALARMPGVVVYLSQDTEFRNPVPVGERVTANCEIVEGLGNSQYRLTTVVRGGETTVIDGEAVVLVDDPPAE
ncbi:MAG: acyl dehydratase [halophilic archaeon J07HX64]|jgi:Acyl dehydratase|nr:MAG: acyl dehydratase [halophilic archaeon J07HX64]